MDSRLFANKELWQLWTYCLMKANHKKGWFAVVTGKGQTEVEVLPGSFIFGRNTWAKKLKTKPSTLWNQMKKLKDLEYLDIQSNNTCSVVTICNWKIYQERGNGLEQPNGQRVENELKGNCKRTENDLTQSNNDKKVKHVNNDKKKEPPFVLPDWIDKDLWKTFEEIRKKKRAANTDNAKRLLIIELEKFKKKGFDTTEIIRKSIRSGWSDVYEPKIVKTDKLEISVGQRLADANKKMGIDI